MALEKHWPVVACSLLFLPVIRILGRSRESVILIPTIYRGPEFEKILVLLCQSVDSLHAHAVKQTKIKCRASDKQQ